MSDKPSVSREDAVFISNTTTSPSVLALAYGYLQLLDSSAQTAELRSQLAQPCDVCGGSGYWDLYGRMARGFTSPQLSGLIGSARTPRPRSTVRKQGE